MAYRRTRAYLKSRHDAQRLTCKRYYARIATTQKSRMHNIAIALLFAVSAASVHLPPAHAMNTLAEQAKAAIVNEDLDTATDKVESALKETPEQASLHKLAGDIYATRAQSASLFSAPGLAKKALKSYKKAVTLEPSNTKFRLNLMQFYLMAPGIVGGDKKLGAEQASQINALSATQGVLAKTHLHLSTENNDALVKLYADLPKELSDNPEVRLAKAKYLAQSEQFTDALNILRDLTNIDRSLLSNEDEQLVPFKAMLQTGFIGLQEQNHATQGIESFKRYLESAPTTYRLASKNWVNYFLGLSYAQTEQNDLANKTFNDTRKKTKSKALLKEIKSAQKKIK